MQGNVTYNIGDRTTFQVSLGSLPTLSEEIPSEGSAK